MEAWFDLLGIEKHILYKYVTTFVKIYRFGVFFPWGL